MNAIEGGSLRDPTLEPILSLLCFAGWFPQSLLKHESFVFREGHWSGRVGKQFMLGVRGTLSQGLLEGKPGLGRVGLRA